MSSPFFSVIVPVYNVEKYLRKCVDSILSQSFMDFEVILIDDGSPDNCPTICDEYAKRDCRVKVIHKPNGGVSSARNAGLNAAIGEYITFVDSDDWIMSNMLEEFHKMLRNDYPDLAICGYESVDEDGNITNGRNSESITEFTGVHKMDNDLFWKLFSAKRIGSCCDKALKTEFIRSKKLSFDEHMVFCEDTDFILRYLSAMEQNRCISVSDERLYCYMTTDHGSAVQRFHSDQWQSFEKLFSYLNGYLSKDHHKTNFANYIFSAAQFTIQSIFNSFPNISCFKFSKLSGNIFKSRYYKEYIDHSTAIGDGLYMHILKTRSPLLVWIYHRLSEYKKNLQEKNHGNK